MDPLADIPGACSDPTGACDGRTHFVVHQTVDGTLTKERIEEESGGKKGKAHAYVLKSGEIVHLWPFSQTDVFATKSERSDKQPKHGAKPAFALKGKMIHIEIDFEDKGKANDAQYATLCMAYVDACNAAGRVLVIVPHIEVDRGFADGHSDPQNFDYNRFYGLLADAGIDLARVPRFDHERYWGKPNFKIPFDTDTFHWPPVLTGNPHA